MQTPPLLLLDAWLMLNRLYLAISSLPLLTLVTESTRVHFMDRFYSDILKKNNPIHGVSGMNRGNKTAS